RFDDGQVAVTAAPAAERDDACGGGVDGIAGFTIEVEAVMVVRTADAQRAPAEPGGDGAIDGPDHVRGAGGAGRGGRGGTRNQAQALAGAEAVSGEAVEFLDGLDRGAVLAGDVPQAVA